MHKRCREKSTESEIDLKGWEVIVEQWISPICISGGRGLADFCRGASFHTFVGCRLTQKVFLGITVEPNLAGL